MQYVCMFCRFFLFLQTKKNPRKQLSMDWSKLITTIRFGQEDYHHDSHDTRSEFQRDYDRLIFSAPFRRMQNKTQVFPLPGSVFVHNRLTHSLEVSCVGRSLGHNVCIELSRRHPELSGLLDSVESIVSAACLAHDMGNPPFGHSGEKAIDTFFSEGEGSRFRELLSDEQWADCVHFEGNANAFRILTHQFRGRRAGGFVMTYPTVTSVVKYPYSALCSPNKKGKFGFFTSDKDSWKCIADRLGIPQMRDAEGRLIPDCYVRYPLVWLVEAADDICYQVMDIEDAHKLRIITFDELKNLFLPFFTDERKKRIEETLDHVADRNEQVAYLRSCVVGTLVDACVEVFIENEQPILDGTFTGSLIKRTCPRIANAYCHCSDVAVEKIYRAQEVLDIELAGYKIIYMLMEELIRAAFEPDKAYSRQLLQRIPSQYDINAAEPYLKLQAMIDYVSGMTDVYALDLYRKITGMSLPII